MRQLELFTSAPGTGKTFACIELFKKEILKTKNGIDSRSFFILPSREHAERIQNLILRKGVPGLFNAHIFTINDFVAKILGASALRPPSQTLRRTLIREILEAEDPKGNIAWGYFREIRHLAGFHELLADTVKEFKAGLLTVREFEKSAQSLLKDPIFRSKFRDFSLVLKHYERRLAELGLSEPEDELLGVLERLPNASAADLVIFDGFYHFTRAQRALIRAIASWSRHTVVTLTIADPGKKRSGLFKYPERTRRFLLEAGFKENGPLFFFNHRTLDPALLHLAENLFTENPRRYDKPQDSVFVSEAPNLRDEIQMVAREIKKIRRETGCHFSDICLILRQVHGYEKAIRSVFFEFQIPVHVHERQKLIEDSLVRLLCRFLSLNLENWRREDLMFILKSFALSKKIALEEILSLELISARENLTEGREQWQALLLRENLSDNTRNLLESLLKLGEDLASAKNIRAFTARVVSWLQQIQSQTPLAGQDERGLEAMSAVRSILQSAQAYYERSKKRLFLAGKFTRELRESLETGLFSVKQKGKNCVQVYDAVMALPKEFKVVFMPGLLEKVFPQNIMEDPLFKDSERRILNRKEPVLEERLSRIAGERYFFYMAIARAKQKLYLSYPRYNAEGREALASFFIEEAVQCFLERPRSLDPVPDDGLSSPEAWESEYEITRGLAEIIFRVVPEEAALNPWIHPSIPPLLDLWVKNEDFREILEYGLSDASAKLRDPKIRRLFQDRKEPISATRLETFATCAFKYFSGRVLNLNEPFKDREAMEMGNLLHQTLEAFYKGLSLSEKESGAFLRSPSAMEKALHQKLASLITESAFKNEPLYRRKMYENSMKGVLTLFVERERELFEKRGLVPAYLELKFGAPEKSDLDYLKIKDPKGDIRIEGKIDRIDLSRDRSQALVIDYKRSEREWSVHDKLKKGLEFQLPIYILAVRNLLKLDVIGAELRILTKAKEEGVYREDASDRLGLGPRRKTYNEQEFEAVLGDAEGLIKKNLERLKNGDIAVDSKSCGHCDFSSVCRFEPWRLVYTEEAPS